MKPDDPQVVQQQQAADGHHDGAKEEAVGARAIAVPRHAIFPAGPPRLLPLLPALPSFFPAIRIHASSVSVGSAAFDPRSANGGWESANGGRITVAMEPYEQEQWKELDQRLAEAEKKLLATANLVRAGIPMVVSQQMRIDALIDSDARLYLQMQQLIESQQRTDETVERLAESVQKFVDSMKSGGNGAH